jgi:excisionase family DNA binding protein
VEHKENDDMTTETVTVAYNNNIDVTDAAKILGCSYPYIIHLIKNKKLKAKKEGKKWLVDADDVKRAKAQHLVTPRPRKNNVTNSSLRVENISPDEVEIRIKLPKIKYQLLDIALRGKDKKSLKEILEAKVDELHEKVTKHFAKVTL